VTFLARLLHGDLGRSVQSDRPIADDLRAFFPATVELTAAAMIIALVVGVPLGVLSAVRQNSVVDHITRMLSLFGVAMPLFWLGLLLQLLFYYRFGVAPGAGRLGLEVTPPEPVIGLLVFDSLLRGNLPALKDSLLHLVLPATTLGYSSLAIVTRMTRANVLEVLQEDYVRTARAKGLSDRRVTYKHALRNAIIPILTIVGLQAGYLLGGTVLVETIFSWPGMGLYSVNAILNLDFPVVIAVTLAITVVYMFINLMVDMTYAVIDPRIRYG
jgi:peptide/nickel transport system permease protein